nr:NIL domain-containing protein [bacterium]
MASMTVSLVYPPEHTDLPIIYRLVQDYHLVFSILRAEVGPGKVGRLTLALTGQPEQLQSGLHYLEEQSITVRPLKKTVLWNQEKCVHCGACTAVCPSGALTMGNDAQLRFTPENCLACEMCLHACPLRAMDVDLFAQDDV